jgi:hypothetical protein
MSRKLLAIVFVVLFSSTSHAENYLLSFELVGSDKTVEGQDAGEVVSTEVVHSIEVLARPGQSFYAAADLAGEKITVSGNLQRLRSGDEKFKVTVRYVHGHEEFAQRADDENPADFTGTIVQNTTALSVGERAQLGGLTTRQSAEGHPTREQVTRLEVVLSRYELGELRSSKN